MMLNSSAKLDGLKLRCGMRDLKWGLLVPLDKYKDKVGVFITWNFLTSICNSRDLLGMFCKEE